ncbi:hypothetical protein AK812_SmicGene13125 [Symbiodinium microadriaticum]|uniref:Uncharacterized protein n=1 Tax=Symbiodinium microadriaticum TaxID=2951 RepID=A0A1Q9E8Z1_SYMMI|nr:hypothetical protein AK812_SmicGene13125 [Symbiodinium microadriaticum]CAE7218174.1 unnamed protein product [Symbiodinium microadriaticum]
MDASASLATDVCIVTLHDCPLPVYKRPGEVQHKWSLPNVLEAVYPTAKPSKRKEKWDEHRDGVIAMHEIMWPGVVVPMPKRLDIDDTDLVLCITTSVFVALLTWGYMTGKRAPEARELCGHLLHDLLRMCCETADGFPVTFPAVGLDGSGMVRTQTIDGSMVINCWTTGMLNAVSLLWDRDILDDKKIYPKSTRTRTTVSDYVLWALEPVPQNSKDKSVRDCKERLAPSALVILTHAALHMETVVLPAASAAADDPENDRRFAVLQAPRAKRRRLATVSLNSVAAQASEKLFAGMERWAQKAISASSLTTALRAAQLAFKMCVAYVLRARLEFEGYKHFTATGQPTEVFCLYNQQLALGAFAPAVAFTSEFVAPVNRPTSYRLVNAECHRHARDLKVDAIEELLGAHYLMHQLQVSPADTGRYLFDVHEAYAQGQADLTYLLNEREEEQRAAFEKLYASRFHPYVQAKLWKTVDPEQEEMAAKAKTAAPAPRPKAKATVTTPPTTKAAVPVAVRPVPAPAAPPPKVATAPRPTMAVPVPKAVKAVAVSTRAVVTPAFDPRSVAAAAKAPTPAPAPQPIPPEEPGIALQSSHLEVVQSAQDATLVEWLNFLAPNQLTLMTALTMMTMMRFDKGECMDCLRAEYDRLGRPMEQLQYTPAQARDHVLRLMTAAPGTDPAAAGTNGLGDGSEAMVAVDPEPNPDPEPVDDQSYEARFVAGSWQLVHLDADGEIAGTVSLPALEPTGAGFWQIVQTDTGPVAWQGGDQEGLPCSGLFPTATGAGPVASGTGGTGEAGPALLPGMTMRLPDEVPKAGQAAPTIPGEAESSPPSPKAASAGDGSGTTTGPAENTVPDAAPEPAATTEAVDDTLQQVEAELEQQLLENDADDDLAAEEPEEEEEEAPQLESAVDSAEGESSKDDFGMICPAGAALNEFVLSADTEHLEDVRRIFNNTMGDMVYATLQVLQHSLKLLAGIALEDFVPSEEYCKMLRGPMDSETLKNIELPPLNERFILKVVAKLHEVLVTDLVEVSDEEARQWRAWNLLFSVLDTRGYAHADFAHPLWNDWRRSLKNVNLLGVLLKCTGIINYGAGPYRSGHRRITLKQGATQLMKAADDDFMAALTERVLFDRGWDVGTRVLTKDEFMASRAEQVPRGRDDASPPDQAENAAPDQDVNSKAAFNLLRQQFASTDAMIEAFLKDHGLHLKMRALIFTGRVLQSEYAAGLETHKEGQLAMLRWQAERSCGSWFQVVCRLFDLLRAPAILKSLELTPCDPSSEPASLHSAGLGQDIEISESMWDLVTELASARCWSQLHHSLCFPNCFVRVFAEGRDKTRSASTLRRLVEGLSRVDAARRQLRPGRESLLPLVQELADDIATMDWVLTREMIVELEKCNYDLDDQGLREMAFAVHASSAETKNMCENSFNWLADTNKRQSVANKMSQETKYMGRGVTKAKIKKWRPAGYQSQRRSAAAMAFIMQHTTSDGDLDVDALRRCLLLKGHVYQRSDIGSYILCLGFMKYACLGIHLEAVQCMGEVYLQPSVSDSIYPTFVFNGFAGSDSTWRHVPTTVVPPACAPRNAIMLKRKGPTTEAPLKSALMHGVFLTREQVVLCMQSENIDLPEKGSGSGANGRVVKIDLVNKLLAGIFGDSLSEAQLARIRKGLAAEAAPADDDSFDDGSCPLEILQLLSTMDDDNKDAFKEVKRQAADMLEERSRKQQTRSARAAAAQDASAADGAAEVDPPAPAPGGAAEIDPPAPGGAAENNAGGDAVGPARVHEGSAAPRPRATRKLTPESLKMLLPPMEEAIYLKWKSGSHSVQVEFYGYLAGTPPGVQRTKQASWPMNAGVDAQVRACRTVFDFVHEMYHTHFTETTGYSSEWPK